MPTEVLKNNVQTTLLSAIDSNDTVITPTDPTGFPATGEQARAAIGDEILIVAGGDGPQFDVTRGAEGTTAVGHAAGEAVRLVLTSDGFSALAELGSALKVTTRRLTTAELSTLGNTPVELVPGVPGALLIGVSVVRQNDPGIVAFGSDLTASIQGGASGTVSVSLNVDSATPAAAGRIFPDGGGDTSALAGQPITVSADANPTVSGAILTSSLNSGGSGYAEGDTGTVNGGNGNATYVVDTVDGGGAILTYTITDGGTGYEEALGAELIATTGVGVDGAIDITSIDAQTPDMEATFTVAYYVVPVA